MKLTFWEKNKNKNENKNKDMSDYGISFQLGQKYKIQILLINQTKPLVFGQ